ncbi:MAG: serine hydrolase [Firmicutes bacterium]|nr:serine hydrolase [Bacillota bacterium]
MILIIVVIVCLCRSINNRYLNIQNTDPVQSLLVNTGTQGDSRAVDALKIELENYIKNYKGQYGIYYYNIVTGEEFGINEADEYTAASTIKVPLNLYLYNNIKSGAVDPQGTIKYLKDDYEGGTGKIQYEKVGNTYTIDELSKFSIVLSDNVAANMLIRFLGIDNIKQYMRQVGGVVVQDGQNVSCPKDMGLYMRLVYEFSSREGVLGQQLMDCFLNTQFNDMIPALLPTNIKVAHKIGNQVGVVNDVGIVFSDRPYILAVMSKDVDEKEAATVLPIVSKKVFDYATN